MSQLKVTLTSAEIYDRYYNGETQRSLARKQKVSIATISRIMHNERLRRDKAVRAKEAPDEIELSILSVRLRNGLLNAGYQHFSQLDRVPVKELLVLPNIGSTSVHELDRFLKSQFPQYCLIWPHDGII